MSEPRDMDAPVTRRELHEALEIWGGALDSRIDSKIDRVTHDVITQVKALLETFEHRVMGELRAQMRGMEDALGARFDAFESHYKGLPERVSKLEAKAAAPKSRRR